MLGNRVFATFTFFTRVSWYQKRKTNLDFTEIIDSEWQWHQLGQYTKYKDKYSILVVCIPAHWNQVAALQGLAVDQR